MVEDFICKISNEHIDNFSNKVFIRDYFVRSRQIVPRHIEEKIIDNLRPEFNFICYNPVRASILHLLMKASDLNHTMRVEEIARRIGKRHSVVIYHLEQLEGWKLIGVVKNMKHGNKMRRSYWGLNKKCPNLVLRVYDYLLKTFYTMDELNRICSINKNARKNLA